LAVLLGVGMWLTFKIPFTKDIRRFMVFVIINVALPAIILNGFFQVRIEESLMKQVVIIFTFSLAFNIIGLGIGWLFSRMIGLAPLKARETAFLSIFGNTGLIGIPLCASVFGAKGAVFAAIFDAGMSLTLWTIGVLFIQGNKDFSFKNIISMVSAPNVAVLVGLVCIFLDLNPGHLIKEVTASLAGAASPLAMFYIGMLTMTIMKEKRRVSAKIVAIPVTFKLLIFPLLGILVLSFLQISQEIEQLLIVEMAMPSIASASVILALYHADEDYGVMHTLVTSILALVSIPLVVFLGEMLR